MIAKVQSYALAGLEGVPVTVETDISRGLPSYEMVGLPDAAVKESKERVRSAIKNSVLEFPARLCAERRVGVRLADSDQSASRLRRFARGSGKDRVFGRTRLERRIAPCHGCASRAHFRSG